MELIVADKQEQREDIVLRAMFMNRKSLEDLESFDVMVCEALGIDPESEPPGFILDAIAAS
jgi:hypothetical protein